MGTKSTAHPFSRGGAPWAGFVVLREEVGTWDRGICHCRGGLCPGLEAVSLS